MGLAQGVRAVLGADNAWAWVLSVVFLVFTLRAILFKPFMKQMNSSLRMQELQPQMRKIREKYKDDRQRQSEELMKLNKEAGVNPARTGVAWRYGTKALSAIYWPSPDRDRAA